MVCGLRGTTSDHGAPHVVSIMCFTANPFHYFPSPLYSVLQSPLCTSSSLTPPHTPPPHTSQPSPSHLFLSQPSPSHPFLSTLPSHLSPASSYLQYGRTALEVVLHSIIGIQKPLVVNKEYDEEFFTSEAPDTPTCTLTHPHPPTHTHTHTHTQSIVTFC